MQTLGVALCCRSHLFLPCYLRVGGANVRSQSVPAMASQIELAIPHPPPLQAFCFGKTCTDKNRLLALDGATNSNKSWDKELVRRLRVRRNLISSTLDKTFRAQGWFSLRAQWKVEGKLFRKWSFVADGTPLFFLLLITVRDLPLFKYLLISHFKWGFKTQAKFEKFKKCYDKLYITVSFYFNVISKKKKKHNGY